MSCSLAETEEERAKRHAWAEAFWARPEEEVMRDLVFPEEERRNGQPPCGMAAIAGSNLPM